MACNTLLRNFRWRRREENENVCATSLESYHIREYTALTGLSGEVSKSDDDEAGDKLRAGDWEENDQVLLSEMQYYMTY